MQHHLTRTPDIPEGYYTSMAKYDSYVICTSPRSGSTLLCQLLSATGVAGNPHSWFHRPSISDWLRTFDLPSQTALSEPETLAAVFRAAIKQGSLDTGMFGLRLQRHSFDFFTKKLAVLYPTRYGDGERLQAAFGRTLYIHLTRGDKLGQAVSLVRADQTGLWHRAPDGTEIERTAPPREPVYDADLIAGNLAELTAYDEDWERWFEKERIAPVRVTYEELSDDPVAVLVRLLEQLGLNSAAAEGIVPQVAKLADETSQQWVERYLSTQGA